MADGEHQDCPEVIGGEDAVEFSYFPVVVRLVIVVEVEEPQSREKHQSDVDPGLRKRSETEKELADDLVDNEDNFSI